MLRFWCITKYTQTRSNTICIKLSQITPDNDVTFDKRSIVRVNPSDGRVFINSMIEGLANIIY